ncbi:MAG: ABC transporter ATP-binding protein, partial [Myxococcota bacterium]
MTSSPSSHALLRNGIDESLDIDDVVHGVMSAALGSETAAPHPHARLSVRELNLTLKQRVILDDVAFDVMPGEVVGILGPNGSGKSSLMRCIAGLWRPDRGCVLLDGDDLAKHRARRADMGVVFQDPSLDNKLTARENLLLSAGLFGVRGDEAKHRTSALLEFMELSERADERVEVFSGGMRRRLEIIRALIHRPSLLVLDEPTNGLDPTAVERTWNRLFALLKGQ